MQRDDCADECKSDQGGKACAQPDWWFWWEFHFFVLVHGCLVISSSVKRILNALSAVAGTTPFPSSRSSSVRLSQVVYNSA